MPEAGTAYIISLIRHFADLRDSTHGGSASARTRSHFERQCDASSHAPGFTEMNTSLLLDTGSSPNGSANSDEG